MHDFASRFAVALIAVTGLATLALAAAAELPSPHLLARHWQLTSALLGVSLLASLALPSLRLPAIATALASKGMWVAAAAGSTAAGASPWMLASEASLALGLVMAGVTLVRVARQEARWDGVLRSRQEA